MAWLLPYICKCAYVFWEGEEGQRDRERFTLLRLLLCYFLFLSITLGQVVVIVHVFGRATTDTQHPSTYSVHVAGV